MRNSIITQHSDDHGFTLMETALALLVISLAFLTLMGLGRSGLESTHEAKNDIRCEAMANAIFETLRIYNQHFCEQSMSNTNNQSWAQTWSDAMTEDEYFSFPPVAGISEANGLYLKFNTLTPAYKTDNISLYNWNPRYSLRIDYDKKSTISWLFDTLMVDLTIYPDGDTYLSNERFFTTILTNGGGL